MAVVGVVLSQLDADLDLEGVAESGGRGLDACGFHRIDIGESRKISDIESQDISDTVNVHLSHEAGIVDAFSDDVMRHNETFPFTENIRSFIE